VEIPRGWEVGSKQAAINVDGDAEIDRVSKRDLCSLDAPNVAVDGSHPRRLVIS